ncbi:MAG: type 4a pilus biogenesis protein PilO [Candidatus Omnitrophica bacterium]|nr:type 4a pilus biogenesis protein PilO [Candidatus Omnitrophota bacterium]
MTFHSRERRLALLAAILIGCWGLVSWMVQPLWDHLHELRRSAETRAEKLQALNRLVTQMPSIERDYERYAIYLEPTGEGQAPGSLLDELEALARRSNVQLNLKPRPGSQQDRVSRFEVELDVEGAQQSLLAFLDELLRLPRLIAVERLHLATAPAKPDALRANLVLQALTLRQ